MNAHGTLMPIYEKNEKILLCILPLFIVESMCSPEGRASPNPQWNHKKAGKTEKKENTEEKNVIRHRLELDEEMEFTKIDYYYILVADAWPLSHTHH